jgi:Family of unknown function (DUF6084)
VSRYEFRVLEVVPEPYAASPQLIAGVRITESTGSVVHALAIRAQVRIEPQRRGYDDAEAAALRAMFGGRERWADTLRPLVWMHCSTTAPGFVGQCVVDLPMPCSFDFDVVGSRYLHALADGSVPLSFQFSGTIFSKGSSGFEVERVPWDCDAPYSMPVATWRDLMDQHYPNTGWIRLDRELVDQLADYRARHDLTSWDEAVERLLSQAQEASR